MPVIIQRTASTEFVKSWKRSPKPWKHWNGYDVYSRIFTPPEHTPNTGIWSWSEIRVSLTADDERILRNRAYNNWRGKIEGAKASWLTNLLETGETLDMVTSRVLQLGRAARALSRGRLGDFYDEIAVDPSRRSRRWLKHIPNDVRYVSKNAGAIWLEYWTGWAPTIGDLYTTLDVFKRDLSPEFKAKGSARVSPTYVHNSGPLTEPWNGWYEQRTGARFGYQGTIRVDNPNTLVLTELGLLNPLQTAWDLVRLSYVVNWFVNVGGFLDRMDDWYGLSLVEAFETLRISSSLVGKASYLDNSGHLAIENCRGTLQSFSRDAYDGPPDFDFQGTMISSITRAATATSLLVQELKTWSPPTRRYFK